MYERDEEYSKVKAEAAPQSVVFSQLEHNEEIISALEKQVALLFERLTPVSNRDSDRTSQADTDRYTGTSFVANAIASHGNRLMSVSDSLSRLTGQLEV